jgi:small GTP-binding protein
MSIPIIFDERKALSEESEQRVSHYEKEQDSMSDEGGRLRELQRKSFTVTKRGISKRTLAIINALQSHSVNEHKFLKNKSFEVKSMTTSTQTSHESGSTSDETVQDALTSAEDSRTNLKNWLSLDGKKDNLSTPPKYLAKPSRCLSLQAAAIDPVKNKSTSTEIKILSNDLKVIMVGDHGVGKTTMINKFFTSANEEIENQSIKFDYRSKPVRAYDNDFTFQLWDTCGTTFTQDEKLKGAHAFVLVIDLTDEKSLERIWFWVELIRGSTLEHVPIFLLGNKADHPRKIAKYHTIKNFVFRYGLQGYLQVSALSGFNVQRAMKILVDLASRRALNPFETTIIDNTLSLAETSTNLDSRDLFSVESKGVLFPEASRCSNRSLDSFLQPSTIEQKQIECHPETSAVDLQPPKIQFSPTIILEDVQNRTTCGLSNCIVC